MNTGLKKGRRLFRGDYLTPNQSVLSQLRDPTQHPEITYLSDNYKKFKLFRNWNLGRNPSLRRPQSVDLPNDFLAEDASNLGLVFNFLERTGNVKDTLNSHLARFYEHYKDFAVSVEGGTVQVLLREKDLSGWIPASRLSDGTLHFLCLSAILCHPSPPPLICIEEPEIGLHPDILPIIAEMLIEASHRTQIIVTTHSDILVDALSHVPEAVLVCEKESNATSVLRLEQEQLRVWLNEYSLGDLWRSGELGGNRW
ncbi:MAG: AAA family ATPase [Caldilineaceae bacterium SB0664_bin_27]|uniref:AAA family ATPase n=1 Tax=Caldilineaceae bacterium SB0664_bin_27 TaxID=2605260 RepID=A0A6B0YUD3_9CHLR|nr:AAA family ATPase [Caldilineaceae bacterium SB0664_bin_27]